MIACTCMVPTLAKPWSGTIVCTPSEPWSWKSPPWHRAIEKNIEAVAEGDFRTMVLRGCRPWFCEGGDHAGTGDHASSDTNLLPCFANQSAMDRRQMSTNDWKLLGGGAKGLLSRGVKSLPKVTCSWANKVCACATPCCAGATSLCSYVRKKLCALSNQRKTKGQQLKGKIVSALLNIFHTCPHDFCRVNYPRGQNYYKKNSLQKFVVETINL